jgi:hypothetical protein
VTAIAAGWSYTCALRAKCWGLNDYGQLGDETTTNRHTPVAVSGLVSGVAAIVADRPPHADECDRRTATVHRPERDRQAAPEGNGDHRQGPLPGRHGDEEALGAEAERTRACPATEGGQKAQERCQGE